MPPSEIYNCNLVDTTVASISLGSSGFYTYQRASATESSNHVQTYKHILHSIFPSIPSTIQTTFVSSIRIKCSLVMPLRNIITCPKFGRIFKFSDRTYELAVILLVIACFDREGKYCCKIWMQRKLISNLFGPVWPWPKLSFRTEKWTDLYWWWWWIIVHRKITFILKFEPIVSCYIRL